MTLIATALSQECVVQVVDRRLTSNGALYDDLANKAVVVQCADAIFSVAYTGLMFTPERTDVWLVDYLSRSGILKRTFFEVLENVGTALKVEIRRFRSLPPSDRRLTLMMAGRNTVGVPFAARISNYEGDLDGQALDPENFGSRIWLPKEKIMPRLDMIFHGTEAAIDPTLVCAIKKIRTRYFGKPGPEIARALVAIIRRAAKNPTAGHLISPNCVGSIHQISDASVLVEDYFAGEKPKQCLPHFVTPTVAFSHIWVRPG